MIPLPVFTILDWQPHKRDALRGFLSVRFACGLELHNLRACTNVAREWISFPKLPRVNSEGWVEVDRHTGYRRYDEIIRWPDRATAFQFSDAVIAALKAAHPGALDA